MQKQDPADWLDPASVATKKNRDEIFNALADLEDAMPANTCGRAGNNSGSNNSSPSSGTAIRRENAPFF
jgi:hypothetical protein